MAEKTSEEYAAEYLSYQAMGVELSLDDFLEMVREDERQRAADIARARGLNYLADRLERGE